MGLLDRLFGKRGASRPESPPNVAEHRTEHRTCPTIGVCRVLYGKLALWSSIRSVEEISRPNDLKLYLETLFYWPTFAEDVRLKKAGKPVSATGDEWNLQATNNAIRNLGEVIAFLKGAKLEQELGVGAMFVAEGLREILLHMKHFRPLLRDLQNTGNLTPQHMAAIGWSLILMGEPPETTCVSVDQLDTNAAAQRLLSFRYPNPPELSADEQPSAGSENVQHFVGSAGAQVQPRKQPWQGTLASEREAFLTEFLNTIHFLDDQVLFFSRDAETQARLVSNRPQIAKEVFEQWFDKCGEFSAAGVVERVVPVEAMIYFLGAALAHASNSKDYLERAKPKQTFRVLHATKDYGTYLSGSYANPPRSWQFNAK